MCNLSEAIEARGIQKGIQLGREEGVISSIRMLMKNMDWPFEKAAAMLGIPQDQWENYRAFGQ